jgi:hypothetical protein
MTSRFVSQPLELPSGASRISRADLIFYRVNRHVPSYEGRIFAATTKVSAEAGCDHAAYVGSFYVFGHAGCTGDEGHCDLPGERDPFDLRLPHHLEPGLQIVTVTEAITAAVEAGIKALRVTVVAHPMSSSDEGRSLPLFSALRLATYT